MESHTRATLSHHKSEKPAQRVILPEAWKMPEYRRPEEKMEATALFDIFTSYRIFMPFTYQVAYGFMPQRLCPMAKVATQPTLPKALKLAEIYEFEKLYNNTQGTAFGRVASENILLAIRQTNCFASES